MKIKIKEKVKAKFKTMTLPVMEFLSSVALTDKKLFTIDELRRSHRALCLSGDRCLRELRKDGVISYEVKNQQDGIYKLNMDVFDIQILKGFFEQNEFFEIEKEIETEQQINLL